MSQSQSQMARSTKAVVLKMRPGQTGDMRLHQEYFCLPPGWDMEIVGEKDGHYEVRLVGYIWKPQVEFVRRRINQTGLELIKRFEGLRLGAYDDGVGIQTIGYGTTQINGQPVKPGMRITLAEAEKFLMNDIRTFEIGVESVLDDFPVVLNDNQFSALVSLCYNCGLAPISKGKTIRRALEAGDIEGAADGFLLWNNAGGKVLEGLTRRRREERELFLS